VIQIYWTNQENIYNDIGLNINNQPLESNHKNNVVGLQSSNNMVLAKILRSASKIEIEKSYINSSDAGEHDRLRVALSSILEGSIFNISEFEFNLMGSFRWENYSEIGSNFLPKVGFSISNSNFDLYSSFGYNYRIPTFNELYWQPGGNFKLKSEESNNFESGVSYTNKFIGQFTISLDYYRNQIKNMIRWVPDIQSSIWSPQNISAVKGEGIEMGMIIELLPNIFHLISNYSFSRTIKTKEEFEGDIAVNKQLPFIPREMANIGFKVNWKNWQGDFSWSRTGFRYLTYSNDEFLPSHNIVDLGLKYDFNVLNQLCTVNFHINNILNKEYQVMYGYPMPGRNYNISLVIQN
jgi:iron complex outermembrane receptor protein